MGCSETTLIELFIMSKNEAHPRPAAPPHRRTAAPPHRRTATLPHHRTAAPLPDHPGHPHHHCPAQDIAAGKEKWEGRSDASLIDYLDEELTSEYKHLQAPHLQAPQP